MTDRFVNDSVLMIYDRDIILIGRIRKFMSTNKFFLCIAFTVLFFYFSIILIFPNTLLGDPDTLWHIRTGQWILAHAQVPTVDLYSYTESGKRWISTEWLAEILFALSFKIGGWQGVVILGALACAASISIICFYLLRNVRFSIAIGWTAITALAVSLHFLARPHLFAYIVASIWLITLLQCYDRADFRSSIALLCVLIILWANLHPSFTLGLALFYIAAGYSYYEMLLRRNYEQGRGLLFAAIAVTVCAILTPYGISSALLTLQTMNMKSAMQHVAEWHSPDFQQDKIFLFLIVGYWVAVAGFGIRLRGPRLIIFGLILALGLSYTRDLAILFLFTPIIFAKAISEKFVWGRSALSEEFQVVQPEHSALTSRSTDPVLAYLQRRAILFPAASLVLAAVVASAVWRERGIGPPASIAPIDAINYVRKTGITGNVFNDYNFGGYLIFEGIPTFVDGRVPPYTDDFLRAYFDAVSLTDIKNAFQLLDRYKVKWVLLRPAEPLAKALAESDLWNEAYSGKNAVVFVRARGESDQAASYPAAAK